MSSTYLQLVNQVLIRLRESQVTTISETPYSLLISKYVNDVKRQVEDAWNWDALNTTISLNTVAGTDSYTLTGSGRRMKDVSVNDTTHLASLTLKPAQYILDQYQLSTVQSAPPIYYAWDGYDGTDSKVKLFPKPDGVYTLTFNMNVPQVDLSDDSDTISVPEEPVIAGAYAKAIVERGEDGGLSSSEAYALYRGILADYIALEQNRFPDWDTFQAT